MGGSDDRGQPVERSHLLGLMMIPIDLIILNEQTVPTSHARLLCIILSKRKRNRGMMLEIVCKQLGWASVASHRSSSALNCGFG
jgi:hypothetical protein